MKWLSLFRRKRVEKPVVYEPSKEVVQAEEQHKELMQRADRAVDLAFRHAEQAATQTRLRREPSRRVHG